MIELYELMLEFGHCELTTKYYASSDSQARDMAKKIVNPFEKPGVKIARLYGGDDTEIWNTDMIEYHVSYEGYDELTDEYVDFGTNENEADEFLRKDSEHRQINKYFNVYEDGEELSEHFNDETDIIMYARSVHKKICWISL